MHTVVISRYQEPSSSAEVHVIIIIGTTCRQRLRLPVRSPSQVLFFNCEVGGWVCNNHPCGLTRTWGAIQEVAVVVVIVLLVHRLLFQVLGGINLITTSGVQYNCVINRLKVPQHYNNFKLHLKAVWSWLVGCIFAVKSIIGTWWAVVAAYLPRRKQPPTTPTGQTLRFVYRPKGIEGKDQMESGRNPFCGRSKAFWTSDNIVYLPLWPVHFDTRQSPPHPRVRILSFHMNRTMNYIGLVVGSSVQYIW